MSAVPGMAWLAYGRLWVGSLIPTSGRAELSLGLTATKLTQAGAALGRAALPWLSVPGIDGAVADGARFGLVVLILAALAWRLRHSPVRLTEWVAGSDDVGARGAEFGGCIALSTLLLLSFYTLTSGATYFYARYAAPLALVVTVLAALPTARFLQAIPRSLAPLLLITTVPVVAAVMLTYLGQPLARSPFDHDQLAMVEKYVPRGATVAAFNSGTLGYFWDHTINLDGKVNVDALHARGHRLQYIERLRVRWLCDYQTFPSRLFILPGQSRHWRLVARSGQFILLHRDPY
jgi:hypothetical protein